MTNRPTNHDDEHLFKLPTLPPVSPDNGSDPTAIQAVANEAGADLISRVSRKRLEELNTMISDRDFAILASLKKCKFLLTGQVQRLHITDAINELAAIRATSRELKKLKEYGLVKTLKRRIGGVRSGSASYVWHISEAGEKLLTLNDPKEHPRRRYLEPSFAYLKHTLAISECYVQLFELCKKHPELDLRTFEWEPECWRPYSERGKILSLKPDAFASTKCGEYEDRWFIEIDLDTESPVVVVEKCQRYLDYYRTQLEQKQYGIFPVVVWIVPSVKRKDSLISNIKEQLPHGNRIFVVITPDELEILIKQGVNPKILI